MAQMCPNCSRNNTDRALNCIYCQKPLLGLLGHNTLLDNRYKMIRVLGSGGFGAVYLAEDIRIPGRQVAVKENRPDLYANPQAVAETQQQFRAEAKLMINLRHAGLPNVSDQFTEPSGRQYMVMDYIEGETLEDLVAQRGSLPEAEVIDLTQQLLDILEYLHSQQPPIVHRDVKPANIKRRPDGQIVLVDFGIAKVHGQGTQSWAQRAGTPGFAPLEQYGHRGASTDARSDIYSLGAVMYYLLTGQEPPPAPDLAAGTLLTPLHQLKPQLSLEVQRVVFKAMAVNIDNRYQSVAEMRQALLGGASKPLRPPPPPPAKRAVPSLFVVIGGVGIILTCLVLVLMDALNSKILSPIISPVDTATVVVQTDTPSPPPLITTQNVARLTELARLNEINSDLAWSPNGETLALAGNEGITFYQAPIMTPTNFLATPMVQALAFNLDGRRLLTGGADNVVRLQTLPDGEILLELEAHTGPVTDVAFGPRGKVFASSSRDNSIRIWHAAAGTTQHQLSGHTDWVLSIFFSPDGRWLASGSRDRLVKLWDIENGTEVHTFEGHTETVTSVAIAPDGRLLASGSEDRTVRLWDLEELAEKHILTAHLAGITTVTFNPDGRLLATGDMEGTIHLWDVGTGVLLRTLKGHTGEIVCMHFNPDGRWLASGSKDATVILWGVLN